MLEFVREDRLPIVVKKIKDIFIKYYKTEESEFVKEWVEKYKDNEMVYNDDFYKANPEYMKVDAMFILLSHNGRAGSITSGERDLEVIDIKEYPRK